MEIRNQEEETVTFIKQKEGEKIIPCTGLLITLGKVLAVRNLPGKLASELKSHFLLKGATPEKLNQQLSVALGRVQKDLKTLAYDLDKAGVLAKSADNFTELKSLQFQALNHDTQRSKAEKRIAPNGTASGSSTHQIVTKDTGFAHSLAADGLEAKLRDEEMEFGEKIEQNCCHSCDSDGDSEVFQCIPSIGKYERHIAKAQESVLRDKETELDEEVMEVDFGKRVDNSVCTPAVLNENVGISQEEMKIAKKRWVQFVQIMGNHKHANLLKNLSKKCNARDLGTLRADIQNGRILTNERFLESFEAVFRDAVMFCSWDSLSKMHIEEMRDESLHQILQLMEDVNGFQHDVIETKRRSRYGRSCGQVLRKKCEECDVNTSAVIKPKESSIH